MRFSPDHLPLHDASVSDELLDFHHDLKKAFDKQGVFYSKKYPEYIPHITLSYAEKRIKNFNLTSPIQWAAHEATLYGGDMGDDRLTATFPFVLNPSKASFKKSVLKLASKI